MLLSGFLGLVPACACVPYFAPPRQCTTLTELGNRSIITHVNTRELLDAADHFIPGACLGAMALPKNIRMVMTHGKGSKVNDTNGKEYIDYALGSGSLLLGHSHPEVIEAVREQVGKGATFYALNEPSIALAEKLVDAVPYAEAVRYQTTGSDAVFSALRLARGFTDRDKVLTFEGAFHGGHDVGQISDCDGIPSGVKRDILVAPFNNATRATDLIEMHRRRLAAVLVEPLQRVLKPDPGFLETLREVTRDRSILLIFDEVVTGFRLAWGGAQERYGVHPDLACYGKVIGGGFPLSAVLGRRDILELADPVRKGRDTYCFLGGTLTGNPVACVAGLTTLEILKRSGTYERLNTIGCSLRRGIRKIGIDLDIPLQVIGDGPVLQTFFVDPDIPLKNHGDLLQADRRASMNFGRSLIRRGIYCTPGGKMYLSLAHTDEDIDRTLEIIQKTLKGMKK